MKTKNARGGSPLTRQAESIARIRAERRAAGLCALGCGRHSETYACKLCRPPKPKRQVTAARRLAQAAAVIARKANQGAHEKQK